MKPGRKDELSKHRAFLTGSYAYGTPRMDSDIDLVVFVGKPTEDLLSVQGDDQDTALGDQYISAGGTPVRFGRLNLILCSCKAYYDVWRQGTLELKAMAPVTREYAIEHMRRLRKKHGFHVPPPPDEKPRKHPQVDDIPF